METKRGGKNYFVFFSIFFILIIINVQWNEWVEKWAKQFFDQHLPLRHADDMVLIAVTIWRILSQGSQRTVKKFLIIKNKKIWGYVEDGICGRIKKKTSSWISESGTKKMWQVGYKISCGSKIARLNYFYLALPVVEYLICLTAVFSLMSSPSESATGRHEKPLRTRQKWNTSTSSIIIVTWAQLLFGQISG